MALTAKSSDASSFLDEPRAGRLNIQYAPDAASRIVENPPRFTWLPVIEDGVRYVLRLSTDAGFKPAETRFFEDIALNFFTPDAAMAPGRYYWSYAVWCPKAKNPVTDWSSVREFELEDGLPETPLPSRDARYQSADMSHPRLWLGPKALAAFSKDLAMDPEHCSWPAFFEKSVRPWIDRDITPEPAPYPNDIRTPDIWRRTYIECQEVQYAIRHLAIAGRVLNDEALLNRATEWLLSVAQWDPEGTTSRAYTDEWAFRITVALAWGYDWLHDRLTGEQRDLVRTALVRRTEEIAEHVIAHANIHVFPYDSHAVRSLSAVLVPACIALLDEVPKAREWLDYTVEFLFTVYSPWGDSDGGWAEGPHYWMTGIAYLIDAANLLRSFADIDIYRRPFFQKTGDFPLYTKAPDTRRACFGDDSTMGDLPCLKVGYNLRQFAGVTGNGAYQWYYDEVKRNDPGTEKEFYNYGWWDLNFDELVYRHDFPQIEAVPPKDQPKLKWFRGIGWVAIQVREDDPSQHVHFVMKSSPFGSISHSHGDQNAFVLAAYGEDLAIQSGHYVAFNTSMHRQWRRQTRSKNAILIDGRGQYADRDKARTMKATGQILQAEEHADHVFIKGDATQAYATVNPDVTLCERDVYFVRDSYFVIVDSIEADTPVTVDWLLHTNGAMQLGADTFRYIGDKAAFYGQFIWSSAGAPELRQEEGFSGVDPSEVEGLDVHWHLSARFPKAKRHRIATLLVPYPKSAPRRIFHFLDDQGFETDLYFTDADEQSFKIVIPKSFAA